jgi:hypothetical protein
MTTPLYRRLSSAFFFLSARPVIVKTIVKAHRPLSAYVCGGAVDGRRARVVERCA